MPRKAVLFIVGLLLLGGVLAWHSMARESDAGLGCYSAAPGFLGVPDTSGRLSPTNCGQPHDWEVISLLRSDGAEERCAQQADAFLGGPWRQSRVVYALLTATDRMRGGLFCALAETADTATRTISSTVSMKDGMRGDRRLAITCLVNDLEDDEKLLYGACDEHHSTEAVGALPDGADPAVGCAGVAAGYLSLTEEELRDRGDLQVRWFEGDRALCLVVEPDDPAGRHDTLRGSVKGLGRAPLPQ